MNFCSQCGQPVSLKVPAGDNRPRHVCGGLRACPLREPAHRRRLCAGVPGRDPALPSCHRAAARLLDRARGIHGDRRDTGRGAIRETWEEAEAQVELGALFAIVDVVHARQVHVFFRGRLREPVFAAGEESLEVRLFAPAAIPWDEIAFPSVRIALERCLADTGSGNGTLHLASVPRIRLG
ncbi:MAG: NUDIX hydrolase [Rhodocyclaceae bacterium]|nr:NUDIX hydrolase [Rhodocyclaceae bacterium]